MRRFACLLSQGLERQILTIQMLVLTMMNGLMIKTRRFYLGAALLVPLFFFSCTPQEQLEPEDEIISPETGDPGSSEGLVKMEFVGTQADEDGSRTYISGSKVLWKGSDKIAVIDEAAPNVHVFDNTDTRGGATCRFIGEAKAEADTWTVVYPAEAFSHPAEGKADLVIPATQRAVEGSFADGSYFTFCRTSSKNVTMIPLLSMLKIHIAYENLTQVRIMANSSDSFDETVRALAGTFRFNYARSPEHGEYGRLNYKSGASYITLLPPDECDTFPAADYYIPVAPLGDTDAMFSGEDNSAVQNLRLEFTRADNQVASRSLTGESIVFPRGKYVNLGTVDEGLSWEYFDIAFGEVTDPIAKTQKYRWPFVSYTDDDWATTKTVAEPISGGIMLGKAKVLQFKLKDSGHIVKAYNNTDAENVRVASGAKALFIGSRTGDYIEFPAIRNRALLRVEVQYDSLSRHTPEGGSGEVVGFSYCKSRTANQCPHITTTSDVNVAYTMSRDEKGFHHNYNLFNTEIGTAYRYRLEYNGENWVGPRIQRIRLYYSKEAAPNLSLPELSASGYSTSLRNSHLTVSLEAESAELVNETAYDVGIVLKDVRDVDGTYGKDSVIFLNNSTPVRNGLKLTWEQDFRLPGGKDDTLNEEQQFYPFVRVRGDATNPVTEMTESSSGSNWVKGSLTTISRPTYTWNISDTENYLYVSDRSVELKATVTVASDVTQNYDVGFIYKVAGAEDTPANWNCTYVDQNGVGKADDEPTPENPIQGYSLANGASKTFTATITDLVAGETYVYKPVIIQHAACYYGKGGEQSSEANMYKYILFEDGYTHSDERRDTISGPVITYGATVPQGYYITATTGSITAGSIGVAHVKSGSSVKVGWVYGTSLSPTTEAFKSSATTVAGTMNVAATSGTLTGLPDVDGSTVYFRPFFAFDGGSRYYYPSAAAKTFTCPVVSTSDSGADYLWRGAKTADLKGTIGIDANGANCKMAIGYQTYNGSAWSDWTTAEDNITTTGLKTISSATLTAEGPQTVKFGVRRHGSSNASTWKPLSITLAHPIASVYTYGSALYTDKNSITAACSIVTNKVASNNLVEYGVQFYRDDSATIRSSDVMTAPAVAADYYNAVLTHDDIPAGTSSSAIRYWCYARLAGSEATPDAVNTTVGSSKSSQYGNRVYTWDGDAVKKRLWICFNEAFSGGYYINPFLPTSASGYSSELGSSKTAMMQAGKFLLAGGHTLEFKLDSGSANNADASPSGVYVYTGSSGAMGLYAHSQADNIVTPAIAGCRAYRVCTYSYSTADAPLYFFVSSSDPTPAFVSGTTAFAAGYGWKNVTPGWGDSYNGKSCYMRFSGCPVTKNTANTTPVTSLGDTPPKQELKIRAFFIEYQ